MATDINLLPVELKTGKDALKASRTLTRLAMVLGGIFLVVVIAGGGVLFFLYQSLNSTRQKEEQLKNQIQSLEGTEQKLVLIKDRIQKTQTVLQLRDGFDSIERYDQIVASLPPDSRLIGLEVENDISKLTILAKNSDDVATIIKSFKDKNYSLVELESLTFNVFNGYELVVSVN